MSVTLPARFKQTDNEYKWLVKDGCKDRCADCLTWADWQASEEEWEIVTEEGGTWNLTNPLNPVFEFGPDTNCREEGDGAYAGQIQKKIWLNCGEEIFAKVRGHVENHRDEHDIASISIGGSTVARIEGRGLDSGCDEPVSSICCDEGSFLGQGLCYTILLSANSVDENYHDAGSFEFSLSPEPLDPCASSEACLPPISGSIECESVEGCGSLCAFQRVDDETGDIRLFETRRNVQIDREYDEVTYCSDNYKNTRTKSQSTEATYTRDPDSGCAVQCVHLKRTEDDYVNYDGACISGIPRPADPVGEDSAWCYSTTNECNEGDPEDLESWLLDSSVFIPDPPGDYECKLDTLTETTLQIERNRWCSSVSAFNSSSMDCFDIEKIVHHRQLIEIYEDEIEDPTAFADETFEDDKCDTYFYFSGTATGDPCNPNNGPGFCFRSVKFEASFVGLDPELTYSLQVRIQKTHHSEGDCEDAEESTYWEELDTASGTTEATVEGELPVELWWKYEIIAARALPV